MGAATLIPALADVMTGWAQWVGFADQLKEFKVIGEFAARVAALPFVVEAHAAMNAAP